MDECWACGTPISKDAAYSEVKLMLNGREILLLQRLCGKCTLELARVYTPVVNGELMDEVAWDFLFDAKFIVENLLQL